MPVAQGKYYDVWYTSLPVPVQRATNCLRSFTIPPIGFLVHVNIREDKFNENLNADVTGIVFWP
jgi:hypothetical protein